MSDRAMRLHRWYAFIIGAIMLLPLVVVLLASLNAGGTVMVPPQSWGFKWYDSALHNSALLAAFGFSIECAATVALVTAVAGLPVGLAIWRYDFIGRRALAAAIMAPLIVPHILLAIGLLELFSNLGVASAPDGLVAGQIVVVLPFVVRLILAGCGAMDPRLTSAARSLGASSLRVFWTVTLPQLRAAALSSLFLAFLVSFDESVISVYTSTPEHTTLPATLLQYYQFDSTPLIATASAMMIIIGIVVVLILDRAFGFLKLMSGTNVVAT